MGYYVTLYKFDASRFKDEMFHWINAKCIEMNDEYISFVHKDWDDFVDVSDFEDKLLEAHPECHGFIDDDSDLWYERREEKLRREKVLQDITINRKSFRCHNGRECNDKTHEICMLG